MIAITTVTDHFVPSCIPNRLRPNVIIKFDHEIVDLFSALECSPVTTARHLVRLRARVDLDRSDKVVLRAAGAQDG